MLMVIGKKIVRALYQDRRYLLSWALGYVQIGSYPTVRLWGKFTFYMSVFRSPAQQLPKWRTAKSELVFHRSPLERCYRAIWRMTMGT